MGEENTNKTNQGKGKRERGKKQRGKRDSKGGSDFGRRGRRGDCLHPRQHRVRAIRRRRRREKERDYIGEGEVSRNRKKRIGEEKSEGKIGKGRLGLGRER